MPELVENPGDEVQLVQFEAARQARLQEPARGLAVALQEGHPAGRGSCPALDHRRVGRRLRGQQLVQPRAPVRQVVPPLPEPPERRPEPQARLDVRPLHAPAQRRPEVPVVRFELVQPPHLLPSEQLRLCPLGQPQEPVAMAIPQARLLAGPPAGATPVEQLPGSVLANRLEEVVPHLAVLLAGHHQ
jgi:hypothetical protein